MPYANNNGVRIYYEVEGQTQEPIPTQVGIQNLDVGTWALTEWGRSV